MAVERIEEYRQKNGVPILKVFCKPTVKFPEGSNFFYAPAEAIDLVKGYAWNLSRHGKRVVVTASVGDSYCLRTIYFHKELFRFYHGFDWNEDVDHISMVEIDETDSNLNAITRQQNQYNKPSKGYVYHSQNKYFRCRIHVNGRDYRPYKVIHREDEACIQANYIEQVLLREMLGNDWYMFDFKKYRRGSEDILDLERRGVLSEEEATYRHILRYAENAWFYLRYGLQDYFMNNHISVPEYHLDTEGFMIHPITGQRLCPFN